jgi:hypothetical protein
MCYRVQKLNWVILTNFIPLSMSEVSIHYSLADSFTAAADSSSAVLAEKYCRVTESLEMSVSVVYLSRYFSTSATPFLAGL